MGVVSSIDDTRALVRTMLVHAADLPWTIQGIGLLALRLDDRRVHRLHVWDPDACVGESPIHDHPYDFTSTVLAGQITNTRYAEDPAGKMFRRERYTLGDESGRRTDAVSLIGSAATHGPGDQYHQLAHELHDSRQIAGTVTLIRCNWQERSELTVCLEPDAPWVTGESRAATADEVKRITAAALDLLVDDPSA
jgi:hypothetical protein